jgi:type II secretion system protein H
MTAPGTPPRKGGYSLVEVLIVVLIMAIMAAIVVPSIGTAGDTQSSSGIKVLQSDLDLARSMALTTGQPYAVVFSNDMKSYKVVANYAGAGGDYAAVTAIDDPAAPKNKRDVTLSKLNKMDADTISYSLGGKTYVKFMSQGDPEVGGTITVTSHGQAWTITIQTLTGMMSVAKTAG